MKTCSRTVWRDGHYIVLTQPTGWEYDADLRLMSVERWLAHLKEKAWASASMKKWKMNSNDFMSEFQAWAQSRARHADAANNKTAWGATCRSSSRSARRIEAKYTLTAAERGACPWGTAMEQ